MNAPFSSIAACGKGWVRACSVGGIALAAWCAACGGGGQSSNAVIQPDYNKESGRLERLRHDANGNGVAETTSYVDGGRIVRIEVDLNEDGRVDRWEYYGTDRRLEKVGFSRSGDGGEDAWSYADAAGSVVRVEIAAARRDRVTRTEYFDGGVLTRAEEDSDADGVVDKWETYEHGRLARLAFAAVQGEPVHALVYAVDGSVRLEGITEALPAAQISER